MAQTPHTVNYRASFEILPAFAPPAPVCCELSYQPADPFAVTASFSLEGQTVAWTFARSLLRAGMHQPVGDGDVALRPGLDDEGHATVYLELRSPQGAALLRTRTSGIAAFLDLTQRLIPVGAELEGVDMDAVVSTLLHETSA